MSVLDAVAELTSVLAKWEELGDGDPVPILTSLAEQIEKEIETWYKMDPDPFDDRHPGRVDPDCALGHLLKAVFKNEDFMERLVGTYLTDNRDDVHLQSIGCRLLLDLVPGLDTSLVFQDSETLVKKLVLWTKSGSEPLCHYAAGLLGGAMEIQDIAANFKENNAQLVPLLLKKLHVLMNKSVATRVEEKICQENLKRPFANVGSNFKMKQPSQFSSVKTADTGLLSDINGIVNEANVSLNAKETLPVENSQNLKNPSVPRADEDISSPPLKKQKVMPAAEEDKVKLSCDLSHNMLQPKQKIAGHDGDSNSSWAEIEPYVIGKYKMWPLSLAMQQRLILQYLTPMGEYQELLGHVFEQKAMELIFFYLDLKKNDDVRLAFEATKYLAALLCHKKFAIEFIQLGGVQKLLSVHRPSVAATGVSMCLYYLAYFEDAMERVCLLPHTVLNSLVSFVLWLLECSHESGRCHATMFFGMSFSFRIILELFDAQDGLRKLYNSISTLSILNIEENASSGMSEDAVFTSRQTMRHVCAALKRYFEPHMAIKADQIRRSHYKNGAGSPVSQIPHYKSCKLPLEAIQENMDLLLDCSAMRFKWESASCFLKLGGPVLLLQMVAMAADWNTFTGKAETIKSALDVLAICAVTPKTQLVLCEAINLPENVSTPAISILLGLAEGEFVPDPDVQKSALSVIINCVCGPSAKYSSSLTKYGIQSVKKKKLNTNGEDLLSKMWNNLRSNNGIMVLLKLLIIKTPVTEADAIRALACRALDGLARSHTIKQIISKLPLFNNGQLQMLMKEPVLQDKRQEHIKFCKHATSLMEKVSGKIQNPNIDVSLERIRRADIVAQTKIVYQEKELLQLIQEHLLSKGLMETADLLQKEANLPRCSTPPTVTHPEIPTIFSPISSSVLKSRYLSQSTPATCTSAPILPSASSSQRPSVNINSSSQVLPSGPMRLNVVKHNTGATSMLPSANFTPQRKSSMSLRRSINFPKSETQHNLSLTTSPLVRRSNSIKPQDATVSLDKIVTEYLRKQHAGCRNPVVTCPPFSLLQPHMCPEPRHRSLAPANITSRMFQKQMYPPFGGSDGKRCDRKYIYSRFRAIRNYRDTEDDGCFSCCSFSANESELLLGTYAGEIKVVNVTSGEETANYVCHTSPINHCEPTRNGQLILTCSSWGQPLSALWRLGTMFEMTHGFEEDSYVEFSKRNQDKIVGTKDETAHIYDVVTGRMIVKLFDQDKANNYTWNRATFSPADDLVLNDGVLWDVNSGQPIHKFDKFNPNISGVFHPMGQEIIINSEVWDLRTFQLLHTVPGLDQCQIRFNKRGDVLYGTIHQNEENDPEDDKIKSPFGSSFRTFDGTDYSNIATIDVKKNIFDLCTDSSDCYLAVVENLRSSDELTDESVCRLYEVGCQRAEDDDQGDDDDDNTPNNHQQDEDVDDDFLLSDIDEENTDEQLGDEDVQGTDNQGQGNNDLAAAVDESGDDGGSGEDSDVSSANLDTDSDSDDDDILFELSDMSNGPWGT